MNTSLNNIDFEPLTEVKAKLSEKIAKVDETNRLLAITLNGKPKAIVIPYNQFLQWMETISPPYTPRQMSLKDWEKESKNRQEVAASINNLFDLKTLSRKGQKPYKNAALQKFKKS